MSAPAFEPVACVVASLFRRTVSEELSREKPFRVYASEVHAQVDIGASPGLTLTPAVLIPGTLAEYERLVRIAGAATKWRDAVFACNAHPTRDDDGDSALWLEKVNAGIDLQNAIAGVFTARVVGSIHPNRAHVAPPEEG